MEYENRKYPRLKQYNYSLPGYYFITIHNERDVPPLSDIRQDGAERASVHLSKEGIVAQEQLWKLEDRFNYLRVDKYVIMPTHIHIIFRLQDGMLPRSGIPEIVGAYKSLVTREINLKMQTPGMKRFQRSFYDTVLRNEKTYQECWLYIDGNPDRWKGTPEDI